jgi:hypothetical protein
MLSSKMAHRQRHQLDKHHKGRCFLPDVIASQEVVAVVVSQQLAAAVVAEPNQIPVVAAAVVVAVVAAVAVVAPQAGDL